MAGKPWPFTIKCKVEGCRMRRKAQHGPEAQLICMAHSAVKHNGKGRFSIVNDDRPDSNQECPHHALDPCDGELCKKQEKPQ